MALNEWFVLQATYTNSPSALTCNLLYNFWLTAMNLLTCQLKVLLKLLIKLNFTYFGFTDIVTCELKENTFLHFQAFYYVVYFLLLVNVLH